MINIFKRKSGVDILTGFKLHSSQLLDARQNVDTIAERDALVTDLHLTTGGLRVFVEENKKSYIFNGTTWDEIGGLSIKLSDVATSGDYNDLINKPDIPRMPELSVVATTGNYNDLLDRPQIPSIPSFAVVATSGDYNDLINKPDIPELPNLATVATSGSYNDLSNKPEIPTLPTLSAIATSGDYNDLINKPIFSTVATSGKYSDLTGRPTFATVATSGSYNDLINKPTIPTVPTLAAVAKSGNYNDLSNKPTIPNLPSLPTTAGTTKYLREDGTWVVPPNTVYTHPTTAGNKHIPAGGAAGQVLKYSAAGTATWGSDTATTCPSGTVLFSTSSTASFFNACFGGTWTVLGYVDALIGSKTTKLYAFKKN